MTKSVRFIASALLFTAAAFATDYAKYEIYTGYQFVRFNPNSGYIPSFNANGGGGQFVYNFDKWIGAAVDLGAVTKGTLGGYDVDTTVVNFMAGPRFTWQHRESRFKPFGQVLFGGAYSTISTRITVPPTATQPIYPPGIIVPPGLAVSARLVASHTGFAMLAGGGLDFKVSKHIFFRPVEADYYLTRLPNLNYTSGNHTNRNNFRYSAGVNFVFGKM
jgi:hypothetical protein